MVRAHDVEGEVAADLREVEALWRHDPDATAMQLCRQREPNVDGIRRRFPGNRLGRVVPSRRS